MIKRTFDTRWGFASLATLLPINWHSLFHDKFDPGPFLTIYKLSMSNFQELYFPTRGRINPAPRKFAELVSYKFS